MKDGPQLTTVPQQGQITIRKALGETLGIGPGPCSKSRQYAGS